MTASTREEMWAEIVPWLDHSCPNWIVAYQNERKMPLLRRGHFMAFRGETSNAPQPVKLRMTPEQATLFKLFWGHRAAITDLGTFNRLPYKLRKIAARQIGYDGPAHEFPVELLRGDSMEEAMQEFNRVSLMIRY